MRLTADDQLAVLVRPAGPARDAGRDHFAGQLIEFRLPGRQRALQFAAQFRQRAATHPRIEEVGRLDQRRTRQIGRHRQYAVLHLPVLGHQHGERARRLEPHELDLLEPHIGLGGEHHTRRAGEARQHLRGFGEYRLHRLPVAERRDIRFDRLPVGLIDLADLHQGVDEEPQTQLGRQPPRRCVRRVDQPEMFQVGHHVAHRRG